LYLSTLINLGWPIFLQINESSQISAGITYSTDSSRIIHQEFGQTVAVKKLTKIEKLAIKLSQWIN